MTGTGKSLEIINDQSWPDFSAAPLAVLMLAETTCPVCKNWSEELSDFLRSDSEWGHVRFGKINLDEQDADKFRESNREWLELIDGLPFNVYLVNGEPVNSFAGSGTRRMLKRLARIEKEHAEQNAESG